VAKSRAGVVQTHQTLQQILFSQGFGTRRECDALIVLGRVRIGEQVYEDPDLLIDTTDLVVTVDSTDWPVCSFALVVLNKPSGFECSTKPKHHPGVLTLLPDPLRARSKGGLQPVGRLDVDTTGLLLLTDDGALIHRLTSPKHHVPKIYHVSCYEPISSKQLEQLATGVVLDDDPSPVVAQDVALIGPNTLAMTLTEGKYHQVKRMIAAVGNHVTALHREQIGRFKLPADLLPGHWQWLKVSDL
jgi:16S rRNA pseudouridine516 synthase